MAEHLAMLDRVHARADELHVVLFEVYGLFQRASHALSAGDYPQARRLADDALADRPPLPRRQRRGRLRRRLVPVRPRPRRTAGDVARERAHARRQPPPADVADRRRAQRSSPPVASTRRGSTSRISSVSMACSCATTRCSCPARARWPRWRVAIDDPERAAIVRRSLEPYADRIATSGLAGISIGPVSRLRRAGRRRRPATSPRASARHRNGRPTRPRGRTSWATARCRPTRPRAPSRTRPRRPRPWRHGRHALTGPAACRRRTASPPPPAHAARMARGRSGWSARSPDQRPAAPAGRGAVGDVDEVAVVGGHELEPADRLERLAGPVVQVAEHVPLTQVVVAHLLRHLGRRDPSCAAPPCRSP